MWKLLGGLLTTAIFTAFIALVFVEWASGCGESYIDANGNTHIGECMFLPSRKEK